MEILNSLATWAQILGLPIALITIAVTVWISWRDKQKLALGCEFQSLDFPLEIKASDSIENDIKIHYRGQPVENLFVTRIRLKNIGNQPIRKSHVVEPVKFALDSETSLLRIPRILDKEPENLLITWAFASSKSKDKLPTAVFLNFDLLNPNDEFTSEFLCTGKVSFPNISARIEGMRQISVLDIETVLVRKEFLKWANVRGKALLFFLVFMSALFIFGDKEIRPIIGAIWLLFAGFGTLIVLSFLSEYKHANRRNRNKS